LHILVTTFPINKYQKLDYALGSIQIHNRMHKENYPIAFICHLMIEMRLANFLYTYSYAAMQIYLNNIGFYPRLKLIKPHMKIYSTLIRTTHFYNSNGRE